MVKVRVDIVEDLSYASRGIGKKYRINKWIFDKKTGRTLDMGTYGTGYNLKEAREAKKRILEDYYG